jgi:hypothetical protein
MFKPLIFCLIFCCVALPALAGPLTVGLNAGSSIPNLRDNGGNDVSKGWSSRLAPFFGLSADLAMTPAFSLEMDVNYAAQGGKRNGMQPLPFSSPELDALLQGTPYEGATLYSDLKTTAKLDYVEIPVLAKYHFGLAKRFFVGAGPYVGLLLAAKTDASGPGAIYVAGGAQELPNPGGWSPIDVRYDNKPDLRDWNWGIQGGAGYQQPYGPGLLGLTIRGGLGLMNLQRDTAVNGKSSTGVLVIALGYSARLGH